MQIFSVTLQQMLILFSMILLGVLFRRCHIIPDNTHITLARLENHLFMPALLLTTLIDKCTVSNLTSRISSLFFAIIILAATVLLSPCLARLLTKEPYEQQLCRYSIVTPNYSFMGNAIALGVFGEDFLFEYVIFTIPLTVFTYSIGINWLKSSGSSIRIRQLLSPVFFAIVIGILIGVSKIPLPGFLHSTLVSLSSCMSPLAMFLTGFIIGGYPIKKLIQKKYIYVLSFLRLILIPGITGILLLLTHIHASILLCAVCMLGMPLGLNTIIIPAAYKKDTHTGAAMALISSIFSVITIPILFMLVQKYT